MTQFRRHRAAHIAAALAAMVATQAFAQTSSPQAVRTGLEDVIDVEVVARRLDEARRQIQPRSGATVTEFSRASLDALPQGDNAQVNSVLLRAPGVAQDSFGQVHVRGDHANLQYRINGVQLPEGLSLFGSVLQSRFAHSLGLITGALPAQYGFRQAGVVDIVAKSGLTDPGAEISIYGGTRNLLQPSFSYGGRTGAFDYFITGDYQQSSIGIENPVGSFSASHDRTQQWHGLANFNYVVDANTRISFLGGTFRGEFQIPHNPGQAPGLGLTVNGISDFDSRKLNQTQREITNLAILSLQKRIGEVDMQISAFSRASSLHYRADPLGELLYNGVAQSAARAVTSTGVQGDASWRINERHTLRGGLSAQIERASFRTSSQVLPVDAFGTQTTDQPLSIGDGGGKTGGLYGIYLQDEWTLTPSVTLNVGGRFDAVDQYTKENQFSPRVSLIWKATSATTLHVGYSRYFTPPPFESVGPTTIALFDGTTGAPPSSGNDTVKAERADYFDAGISHVVIPGLTIGLDAYYKDAKNLLDEGQFGAPIIQTAFNYRRARVYGAELSASYDQGPLSLYGNVAWSRAVGRRIVSSQFNFDPQELAYIDQTDISLDHDQRWTGSAGAAYTLNRDAASPTRLSADLLVQSGLRTSTATVPNGAALPGYAVLNLSVVQKLDLGIGRGTQVRLDVLNVTDEKYLIRDGGGVGVGAPQFGLRRAILAGLTQRF